MREHQRKGARGGDRPCSSPQHAPWPRVSKRKLMLIQTRREHTGRCHLQRGGRMRDVMPQGRSRCLSRPAPTGGGSGRPRQRPAPAPGRAPAAGSSAPAPAGRKQRRRPWAATAPAGPHCPPPPPRGRPPPRPAPPPACRAGGAVPERTRPAAAELGSILHPTSGKRPGAP